MSNATWLYLRIGFRSALPSDPDRICYTESNNNPSFKEKDPPIWLNQTKVNLAELDEGSLLTNQARKPNRTQERLSAKAIVNPKEKYHTMEDNSTLTLRIDQLLQLINKADIPEEIRVYTTQDL